MTAAADAFRHSPLCGNYGTVTPVRYGRIPYLSVLRLTIASHYSKRSVKIVHCTSLAILFTSFRLRRLHYCRQFLSEICGKYCSNIYRVAQKVTHYLIINKSYLIVLKPTNEIGFFFVNLKRKTSTITLSVGIKYSMRGLICDISDCARAA